MVSTVHNSWVQSFHGIFPKVVWDGCTSPVDLLLQDAVELALLESMGRRESCFWSIAEAF